MTRFTDPIRICGAELKFRNCEGRPTDVNPEGGKRAIGVYISDEQAKDFTKAGWNVKTEKEGRNGNPPRSYLSINLDYRYDPPVVELRTRSSKTILTEETVKNIDKIRIDELPDGRKMCDITFHGRFWERPGGKKGIVCQLMHAIFGAVEDVVDPVWDTYTVNEPPADLDITPF